MGRRGGKRRRRNRKENQVETSSGDGNGNGSNTCNIPKNDNNGNEDNNVDDECSRINNNNKRPRVGDKKNDDNNNDASVRSNVQPKIQVTYHDGGGGEEHKGNDNKIVQLPQPIRTLQQDSVDCNYGVTEKKANESSDDDDIVTLYSQIWKYLSSSKKRNNSCSSNQLLMTDPTLIQQHLWSIMMEMNLSSNGNGSFDSVCTTTTKSTTPYNTIGIAPTGSGKTLAYGLPTIVSKQNVLVLVPTRELVQQVGSVYQKLSKAYRKVQQKKQEQHRILMIYGGTNDRFKQRQELFCKNKTNLITTIVVATPGRLLDLLSSSSSSPNNADNNNNDHHLSTTSTSSTSLLFRPGWIILDEADQLAKEGDLGPQVDQILEKVGVSSSSSSSSATTTTTITTTHYRPKIALISATYPQKAHTMFQKWVGKEYVLVEIDSIATTTNTHTASSSRKRNFKNDEEDHNNDDDRVVRSDGEEAFAASGTEESLSKEATNNSNQKLSLLSSRIPSNLNQILHVCSEHKKPKKLIHTLKTIIYNKNINGASKEPSSRSRPLGIVFFSRIEKVKYVSKLLDKERIPNIQLHSQLNTQQRQFNLKSFSCGKYPLLLATDLAARGIDIPSIKFIIQYDFPSNIQQYIHRCGRAGRRSFNHHPANKNNNKINNNDNKEEEETKMATVYSFFTRNLKPMAPDMIKLLEANNAWVDPNLRTLVTNGNEDHQNTSSKKKQKKGITGKQSKNEKSSIATKEQQPSKSKNVAASNNPTLLSNDKINDGNLLDDDDDDDDDFKDLAPNRIILKRASHVSDASSSSSDSDDG